MQSLSCLVIALFFCGCVMAETLIVKIPRAGSGGEDSPSYYPEALLTLALTKTEFIYGSFSVEHVDAIYSSDRLRAMLIAGRGIDVMWSTVTSKREREMRSIGSDIFRGLSSYRRVIVRTADVGVFGAINGIPDLRSFKVGVGAQWSDKEIFAYNNLPLIAGTRLDLLGRMLAAGRFDYLARGLHEYEYDLTGFASQRLDLVENLMLHYCQPVKFFVNKNNSRLSERISLGLVLAETDGSADALFEKVPALVRARSTLKNFNGRIISLENPQCIGEEFPR
jgi:hypothetical protein